MCYHENMEQTLATISQVILDNQLYILPLYSIQNNQCTCGKQDCTSPGKHPLFKYNWKVIASNKPEKITEWFSAHKKMNFGLATGRYSKTTKKYLVVVDVDAIEHPILHELPQTFSYRTGSGGHHLWFWSQYPIKNSVSLLADKVDVRGTDGYVVIPPSNHRKGNYNNINNLPIADLPKDVVSKLFDNKPKAVKAKKTQVKPTTDCSVWSIETVDKVREMMKTTPVPEGVRNTVMHRLLSSDRARGAQRTELETNAHSYLQYFYKPQEFSGEIDMVVQSVMRYPAYNNSHEKVNELYVAWLKKNRKTKLTTEEVSSLETQDKTFFSMLQVADIKQERATLDQITKARLDYLKGVGLEHISNYKPQLLAKKLIDLGFQRHRTAKGNFWNVSLPKPL